MKAVALIGLALLISLCGAIAFVPGSGAQVTPNGVREYDFAYHTGMDDYHFYGSNVWAVRFNFREVYPGMASSEFLVTKALLWFPQTGDSVRAELFRDAHGAPGSSMAWAKVPVNSNQLEINFPTSVQEDTLWLVVSYNTNFSNRYVSASEGGGSHSYYWNTNAQTPYFQSFSGVGYSAELLFGLAGDFVLSGLDLELVSFDMAGSIKPRETVGPTFSIYNHSDQPVSDAVVGMNVYSPNPDFAFYDEISIPESIAPHSLYVFDAQNPAFSSHQFELPATPMQLKFRAALSSGLQDSDPQANNVILLHRFSFENDYPIYLGENFLRYDNAAQITTLQDLNPYADIQILNYFPILSDTLGNVPAQIRFNWYGFNSLPRTAINGDLRINGFSTSYTDQYNQICQQARDERTFVSQSECRLNYIVQNDLLSATFNFTNASTLLYTSATEYNLAGHSVLCVGMFKKTVFNDSERWVIARWITHGTALGGSLNAGETYTAAFNIPLNSLPLSELSENYRIYYWLQLEDGGKILYSAWSDFTGVVSVQDDLAAVPGILVSSNPLRPGGSMAVRLSGGQNLAGLQIYNIRGQKIIALQESAPEIRLTADLFPSSGVYILRAAYLEKGRKREAATKINIIK